MKILGVTLTSTLSMSKHVDTAISACAQTLFALKTLRAHEMKYACLKTVYKAGAVAKLLFGASAWLVHGWIFDQTWGKWKIVRCE